MGFLGKLAAKLTYANVVATLALFIALGGASYAAVQLPKNSVGTKQVKNKAITLKKLSPATIAALKGGTGAPGSPGPQGAAGTKGADGATGAAGPGSVAIDVLYADSPLVIPSRATDLPTEAFSKTLTAGGYTVGARIVVETTTGDDVNVTCTLSAGARQLDSVDAPTNTSNPTKSVSLQSTFEVTGSEELAIRCHGDAPIFVSTNLSLLSISVIGDS